MIKITIAYATPQQQVEIPLAVPGNSTVALAIQRSGILQQFPEISLARAAVGIHSHRVALDDLLHDGDRVEIYRPLQVDPKQARLARARRQLVYARSVVTHPPISKIDA